MSEYVQVARHLGEVRRAWKRAAALAGLSIVCMESVGILIVALLVDWVYRPAPGVRTGLLVLVVLAVGVLFVRHVVRPLMRKISDDQLALFVEEHSDQFEGALITATELKEGGASAGETPKSVIDAVMRAAVMRAEKGNVRSAVDWRRLKKYGLGAVFVMAGYGLVCLMFPNTIGRHASRVLAPWQKSADELQRQKLAPGQLAPLEFALSKGDSKVLRRSTFDLEATLSRASSQPVVLNFRPAGQANLPWRAIPMKEIEKLNTFSGAIADLDEDKEFFVSSGDAKSAIYKVGVFDPLKITGFEVTTKYPAYLQLPDKTETLPTADVAAPAGSKVVLKVLSGSALTQAEIVWADGKQQAMTLAGGDKTAATVAFDVNADTSFSYAVHDANGQTEKSPIPASVTALQDGPPTLEVKFPLGVVATHSLGEITFAAEAVDDLAIGKVELVYQRQIPQGGGDATLTAPVRVPMLLARDTKSTAMFPDVEEATLRFALEDLQPPVTPEEIISYYVECTDRKGQATRTDIEMIAVERFDGWPTFDPKPPHGPTFKIVKNITEYLNAAWKLEQQKGTLKKEDFLAQTKALADSMIDPESKRLYEFYERKRVPPDKIAHADRADKFIASGHRALEVGDTAKAVMDFRVVLAELTIIKLDKNAVEMFAADYGKKGAPQDFEKDLKGLFKQVTVQVDRVQAPPGWNPKEAKASEKLRKAAEDLAKKQDEVVKKAEEIAQAAGQGKPGGEQKNEDKDKDKAQARAKADAQALAQQQDKVAAEAQKEAMAKPGDVAQDPDVKAMSQQMADAAQAMRDASKNLQENKTEAAVADAKRAQGELKKVAERLENRRQEQVAAAIAEAEAQATKLLNEQKDITKETKEVAAGTDEKKKETEYKKLTYRQAQVQVKADRFKKDVEALKNAAERDAKLETKKHLDETHKEMTKGEVTEKMVNAVVELQARHGKEAGKEQGAAEKGLEKVIAALEKADESMAADRESQLARAKEEAKRIGEGLKKLGAHAAATQPAQAKTPAGAETKPALASKDASAKEPGKDQAKADQPLTDAEKKELAENIAIEMERLNRHLADRDFVEKPEQKALADATRGGSGFADEVLKDQAAKDRLATIVRRVHDKLEAEYQVTLESKRLSDAQREDCPPAYRQLVNKYYEALAETAK
jgi:hypothetical protein